MNKKRSENSIIKSQAGQMAADTTRAKRCSAAKKMLQAIGDSPDLRRQEKALQKPAPMLQKH